ncbi:MAG: chemotaxis protein CheW [Longimicrobiales bacterium]
MSDTSIHQSRLSERAEVGANRFLVIHVDGDQYGLPLEQVREVIRAVWITPLPHAPAVVMGVIDVRGHYVPVFDMRRRFGRISPEIDPSERLVIAWTGERQIALRADTVAFSFVDVGAGALEQVQDVIRRDSFITGLAHTTDGLLLIQDLHAFLTESESAELEDALMAHVAAQSA